MLTGSLCTGYGGLDMAVHEVLGGELAWVADNDPGAAAILAHRFPAVPNLGDITAVDWTAVSPVDILAGGYPCQPFSDAGPRKGTDDERHIWPYFATAIRVLRPRLVVLENVRGHLGRGFNVVLGDLAHLGFDAEWITMPASGVGACHQRQRVFILAWPAEDADCPARDQRRITAPGEAPGRWPRADASRSGRAPAAADATLRGRAERVDAGDPSTPEGGGAVARDYRGGTVAAPDPGIPGLEIRSVEHHGPQCPAAERSGRELAAADWHTAEFWSQPDAFGRYEAAVRKHERAFGRQTPAPLEPGRNGDPRLAPRFAEWMMGMPAGWVTDVPGLSRNDQLHAIGNGVVPRQGSAAIRLLLERAPDALRSLLSRAAASQEAAA